MPNSNQQQIQKYYLGCPIWANKDWQGNLFTPKAKPKDYLKQYSSVFNTVEASSTFYSLPSETMFIRWRSETPSHFRFNFKFPKHITHVHKLRGIKQELLFFLKRMELIQHKTGQLFIQLPPSFKGSDLKALKQFLELLPNDYTYCLEVRNMDFYREDKKEAQLNELLLERGINRALFDTEVLHRIQTDDAHVCNAQRKKPKMPRRLVATADAPFLRFCGYKEVEPNQAEWGFLVEQTLTWIKEGKVPYIFIHSPGEEFAPDIAEAFHKELKIAAEKLNIDIGNVPDFPGKLYEKQRPKQMRLFD